MLYETDIPDVKLEKEYLNILSEINKKSKKIRNSIETEPLQNEIVKDLEELKSLYLNQNEYYSFIDFKSSFFCGIYIGMQMEKSKKLKWDNIFELLENDF